MMIDFHPDTFEEVPVVDEAFESDKAVLVDGLHVLLGVGDAR
jgi:hypothetical protein